MTSNDLFDAFRYSVFNNRHIGRGIDLYFTVYVFKRLDMGIPAVDITLLFDNDLICAKQS